MLQSVGCAPSYNYQIFSAKGEKDSKIPEFENSDIKITYDLWNSFGQLGLVIHNKTNAPLFIDLSQCALVVNDVGVPIFSPSSYTSTVTLASSKSTSYVNYSGYLVSPSQSAGSSVSRTVHNTPLVFLPASAKSVNVFLSGGLALKYIAPDFKLKSSEDAKNVSFKVETSPYRYRLVLGYSKSKDLTDMVFVEDKFWIESIQLMRREIYLGKLLYPKSTTLDLSNDNNYELPYKKPDKFYVRYKTSQ